MADARAGDECEQMLVRRVLDEVILHTRGVMVVSPGHIDASRVLQRNPAGRVCQLGFQRTSKQGPATEIRAGGVQERGISYQERQAEQEQDHSASFAGRIVVVTGDT